MAGLSDTELSAIQGQASVAGLREGFRLYTDAVSMMWSELTPVQGVSPALHYIGWSAVATGYSIALPAMAAHTTIDNAPFPVNRLDVVVQPGMLVSASLMFTGTYLLYLNGEFVPSY